MARTNPRKAANDKKKNTVPKTMKETVADTPQMAATDELVEPKVSPKEGAKKILPKIGDIKIEAKDVYRRKWVKQLTRMPKEIRDKLSITVIAATVGTDSSPIECNVNSHTIRIRKETEETIPIKHYLHLSSCMEHKESKSFEFGADGRPKSKSTVSYKACFPMEVIQDDHYDKIQGMIKQYIQDIG